MLLASLAVTTGFCLEAFPAQGTPGLPKPVQFFRRLPYPALRGAYLALKVHEFRMFKLHQGPHAALYFEPNGVGSTLQDAVASVDMRDVF